MNVDDAVKSHATWKRKLATYLEKPDRSINHSELGQDNKCELGQWLHSCKDKYKDVPEFVDLLNVHRKFHICAAEIVRKADSGVTVSEEVALGSSSKFSETSMSVVSLLMKIKKTLKL